MQEYTQVKSEELRNHGTVVGNTLFLREGVHVRDRKPDLKNELFVKEREKNPYKRKIIQ